MQVLKVIYCHTPAFAYFACMKSSLLTALLSILFVGLLTMPVAAQKNQTPEQQTADQLRMIGVELYQMELASRVAADSLMSKYPTNNIAGYLSYRKGKSFRVIFWQPDSIGKNIISNEYSFGEMIDFQRSTATPRPPTAYEKVLIAVRTDAARRANSDREILAIGLQMNLYIRDDGNRIYAYLSPVTTSASHIVLGGDFVLTYDRSGNFVSNQALHKETYKVSPVSDGILNNISQKTFTNVQGKLPYPTATDICTLLLFRHIIGWEEFYYNSSKYISVLNVKTSQLSLIKK